MDIIERLRDEADLCRNEGADDIAELLGQAVSAIEELRSDIGKRDAFIGSLCLWNDFVLDAK